MEKDTITSLVIQSWQQVSIAASKASEQTAEQTAVISILLSYIVKKNSTIYFCEINCHSYQRCFLIFELNRNWPDYINQLLDTAAKPW